MEEASDTPIVRLPLHEFIDEMDHLPPMNSPYSTNILGEWAPGPRAKAARSARRCALWRMGLLGRPTALLSNKATIWWQWRDAAKCRTCKRHLPV